LSKKTQIERWLAGDYNGAFVTDSGVEFYIVDGRKVAKREPGKEWISLRAGWHVEEGGWADAEGNSGMSTLVEYDPDRAAMI
jgi:hypothetical protein